MMKRAEAKGRSAGPLYSQRRSFRFFSIERRWGALDRFALAATVQNSTSGSAPALRSLGVGMSGEIEHEGDTPRTAARAFEALGKHRNGEPSAARPDQRLEVEVVAGVALPDAFHAFAATPGAPGSHTPTQRKGFAERLTIGTLDEQIAAELNNTLSHLIRRRSQISFHCDKMFRVAC
jgi:hypothetical protein